MLNTSSLKVHYYMGPGISSNGCKMVNPNALRQCPLRCVILALKDVPHSKLSPVGH